jgi:DNA-binding transcriptional ArsR family regulator
MLPRNRSRGSAGRWAYAPVFAALGDNARLRIVSRLCDGGPMSISNLTAGSHVTRQAVSKHLRVLEEARLVRSRRRGRERIWQLEKRRLQEARTFLESVSLQWDDALARLRAFVEK